LFISFAYFINSACKGNGYTDLFAYTLTLSTSKSRILTKTAACEQMKTFFTKSFSALHQQMSSSVPETRTSYRIAKEMYRNRLGIMHATRSALFIIIGIFSAGFGLKSFLLPNDFIDGGATGISLLISRVFELPLPAIILFINIPFILLGYKQIGHNFTLRTILAITGLAICIAVADYPAITKDKLLVSVFGGFFLGAGIGFALRGGGVLDGTEVLAIYISRKTRSTIGDVILVINVIIFLSAAYILGIE
jgi:hypothetical protein